MNSVLDRILTTVLVVDILDPTGVFRAYILAAQKLYMTYIYIPYDVDDENDDSSSSTTATTTDTKIENKYENKYI